MHLFLFMQLACVSLNTVHAMEIKECEKECEELLSQGNVTETDYNQLFASWVNSAAMLVAETKSPVSRSSSLTQVQNVNPNTVQKKIWRTQQLSPEQLTQAKDLVETPRKRTFEMMQATPDTNEKNEVANKAKKEHSESVIPLNISPVFAYISLRCAKCDFQHDQYNEMFKHYVQKHALKPNLEQISANEVVLGTYECRINGCSTVFTTPTARLTHERKHLKSD